MGVVYNVNVCLQRHWEGLVMLMCTYSVNGRGVLTIRQARREDGGAYTCEAINNKGAIFAQPDTIVIVSRE